MYNKQIVIKTDSLISIEKYPRVGYDYFQIKFSDASFDENQCKIRLVGKPCYRDTANCTVGWPGVQIFKARKKNNILTDVVLLGESLDTTDVSLSGHFDIEFSLRKNESLFFYLDGYYLEEYKFEELFRQKKCLVHIVPSYN